jgi:hypothetical protein
MITLSGVLSHEVLADTTSSDTLSIFHHFFKDLYSSNTGWTQIGTQVTVNDPSFPGLVKFNNVIGGSGVTETRVVKQLPSTLQSEYWHAKFNYKYTASQIPASIIFALTHNQADPQSQEDSSAVFVEHGDGVNTLFIEKVPSGQASSGIPISPNTQYYVEIFRTPHQLKLSVFSDPARTIHVSGSPVTLPVKTSELKDLNFIQHDGCRDCGSARTLTAQIDNTIIYSR